MKSVPLKSGNREQALVRGRTPLATDHVPVTITVRLSRTRAKLVVGTRRNATRRVTRQPAIVGLHAAIKIVLC